MGDRLGLLVVVVVVVRDEGVGGVSLDVGTVPRGVVCATDNGDDDDGRLPA